MTNPFASLDIESGGSSKDNYINLKTPGEYKIRILSEPLQGWIGWTLDNKPRRFPLANKPSADSFKDKKVSKFMAVIVWDYSTSKLKIFETEKKTILKPLLGYAEDPDFGDLREFDIKISRVGTTKDNTQYSVKALSKAPVSSEIKKAFKSHGINMEALFTGEDPFLNHVQLEEEVEI